LAHPLALALETQVVPRALDVQRTQKDHY
jgi:hypothetical protein